MEVGQQGIDDPKPKPRGNEQLGGARARRTWPGSTAADSKARTVVVPTATTRLPCPRARSMAAEVSSWIVYRSASMRCSSTVSVRIG